MKNKIFTTAILGFLFVLNFSFAQEKWSVELRPGTNYATEKISDAELKFGIGGEFSVSYNIIPLCSVYLGWSYNNFGVDSSFVGKNGSFEETGYTYGLKFFHELGDNNYALFLIIGGTYNHLEIESDKGEIIIDSGHGLGWQTELGLQFKLVNNFSLTPSVRYRSLNRNIEINGSKNAVNLNYLSIGIGINWSF